MNKKSNPILIIIMIILLVGNVLGWTLYFTKSDGNRSYLETDEQTEIILRGILTNNKDFLEGESLDFSYDFDNDNLDILRVKYSLESVAKTGTEFEKTKNLMHYFSPKLAHGSSFETDNVGYNSLELLNYAFKKNYHTINCRCKAQILMESCLSLDIYCRKVWIMPYSPYDDECHVVNEIYDSTYQKWIMFDITNDLYFVDKDKTPLSIMEIRELLQENEPCSAIHTNQNFSTIEKLYKTNITDNLYYLKNMVYFQFLKYNEYEENISEVYLMLPREFSSNDFEKILSLDSYNKSPIL